MALDGVYVTNGKTFAFRRVKPPTAQEIAQLIANISQRVGRYLQRQGLLVRDIENTYLDLDLGESSAMDDLLGYSISYRIAVGPQAGRKAFTLQTVPAGEEGKEDGRLAQAGRFSLHAGVVAQAHQRRKLERLCRYIARPAVSSERMALTNRGNIRYTLKTPYRDGTTHILLEPLEFIARRAALVPKPRVNLTRFHGVFAPNSSFRAQVTPAKRGRGGGYQNKTASERHAAMTWASLFRSSETL